MEAKVCNYTHLVYKITHLRHARLHTIGCVKLHTFVLHTLYLLKMCYFTHLLGKNTPLVITHQHSFPTFTHLLDIYTYLSKFYTPFEYTHLSQFYTPFEDTHLSMLHTFRPKNSILHGNIFLRYIKSIKSVYLGVQPCRRV